MQQFNEYSETGFDKGMSPSNKYSNSSLMPLCSHPQLSLRYPLTLSVLSYRVVFFLFPFLESYMNRIIQHVLLLSFVHHSFEIIQAAMFYCWVILHYMNIPQWVYPFTCWRIFGLLSVYLYYEVSLWTCILTYFG